MAAYDGASGNCMAISVLVYKALLTVFEDTTGIGTIVVTRICVKTSLIALRGAVCELRNAGRDRWGSFGAAHFRTAFDIQAFATFIEET